MKQLVLRMTFAAVGGLIALGAVSAFALDVAPGNATPTAEVRPLQEPASGGRKVEPMLIWTTVGVAVGAGAMATLYLVKRRLGGFPENPSWVAPITIMPSKDSPADGSYGDAPVDAHGPH